jgi:hypothetical protein
MKDKEKRLAELLKEMEDLVNDCDGDEDLNHIAADNILCETLELLGQKELADMFYDVQKWYS